MALDVGFGLIQPVGHLDFYPNGGYHQPGCSISQFSIYDVLRNRDELYGNLEMLAACDHSRAIDLFTDSILSVCQPVAYECQDNRAFSSVLFLFRLISLISMGLMNR